MTPHEAFAMTSVPGVRRLSIRARLTAVFVLASVVVVASVALLLLRDQQVTASERLDHQLVERIDAIELSIRKNGRFPYSELYGEVIDADYTILGMSNAIDLPGLLTQSQADFVLRNGSLRFTGNDPSLGVARFLAQRRTVAGRPLVIVVGAAENTLDGAHRRLLLTVGLGGPALVLLAGLGGWGLAGAVLRPVRKMTDDAAEISRFDASARLQVPPRRDEIAHLGMTLNAMLERLEASYERERSFVDDASHELRTPLAILRGELELALLHPGDAAATTSTIQRSIDEVDRLAAMTDDLLVLARAGREQPDQQATVLRIDEAVTVAVDRLRPTLPPTLAVSVRVEAGDAPPTAAIRRDRLERVVRNLVENAARFAAREITVTVRRAADRVELVVRDDGPGFPPSFLPHAFERFSVASEARTRREGGGTGLGLAIVRAIAESAGGSVEASNAAPGGASVTVRLPAALIEPSPLGREESPHDPGHD